MIKKLILGTLAVFQLANMALASVTFSGGGGSDLVLTITSDLSIPVYDTVLGSGIIFSVVLKNVYSSDQALSAVSPATSHADGIKAVVDRVEPLTDIQSRAYATWGIANDSNSSPRDFVLGFNFGLPNGGALRATDTGRFFIVKAGSVSFPSVSGLQLPDIQPSEVRLYSFSKLIPEPSTPLIAAMGTFALFRRRR